MGIAKLKTNFDQLLSEKSELTQQEYSAKLEELITDCLSTSSLADSSSVESGCKPGREHGMFQTLVNSMPEAIYFKDREARFVLVSNSLSEFMGIPAAELLGKSDIDVFVTDLGRQKLNDDLQVIATGKAIVNKEELDSLPNGETRWVLTTKLPWRDDEGNIQGLLGISTDITHLKHYQEQLLLQKEELQRKGMEYELINLELKERKMRLEQVNTELELTKERFKQIFETNPLGILIAQTTNLEFVQVNRVICEMLGYTNDELLGLGLKELVHQSDIKKFQVAVRSASSAIGKTVVLEVRFSSRTEGYKWTRLTLTTIKLSYRESKYLMGMVEDLVKQKQVALDLEESEQRYRALFKKNASVILLVDPLNGQIIDANISACKYYGYTHAELTAIRINAISRLTEEELSVVLAQAATQQCNYFAFKHWLASGEVREVEVYTGPITVAGNEVLYSIVHDITDRKKAELELIEAKEKAEQSDRLKSQFLSNLSHEVRTPMNGIIGFLELLSRDDLEQDKRHKYLDIIKRSTYRLLTILSDIVDMSKLDSGLIELNISKFSLRHLMEEVFNCFELEKTQADKSEIILKMHNGLAQGDELVLSDYGRLGQVLTHLLNNAIKFTDKGIIEFGYSLQDEATLLFYVSDTGIGIAPCYHEIIFNRFTQVDGSHTRKHGGTGLGLSISKSLITLLGGEVWIDSDIGLGATFYFSIPYRAVNKPEANPVASIDANPDLAYDWSGKQILIVEDVYYNFYFFDELVSVYGAICTHAPTGREALELYQNKQPIDLILMDIQLPDISGYEVAKLIREQDKAIPIIAQTAYAMTGDRKKSLAAGCNDYISKPVDPDKLLEMLNDYLSLPIN